MLGKVVCFDLRSGRGGSKDERPITCSRLFAEIHGLLSYDRAGMCEKGTYEAMHREAVDEDIIAAPQRGSGGCSEALGNFWSFAEKYGLTRSDARETVKHAFAFRDAVGEIWSNLKGDEHG